MTRAISLVIALLLALLLLQDAGAYSEPIVIVPPTRIHATVTPGGRQPTVIVPPTRRPLPTRTATATKEHNGGQ